MDKGKNTCKILKEIRRQIAEANDIEFITSECRYQGDCLGTCPKCEAEVRYLEQQLEKKRLAGKAATIIGVSMGITSLIATPAAGQTTKVSPTEITQTVDSIVVKGQVKDTEGNPLIGANVCEKETNNGTLSDIQGNFIIKVSGKHPLVITYVGCQSQEVEISSATPLQIVLEEDTGLMGEIAVTTQTPAPSDSIMPQEEENIFGAMTEEMPLFPGGDLECMKFIQKNLRYPEEARRKGIEGRVIIQFIVDKDGTLTDFTVARGVEESLDREALRLAKSIPQPWKPGTQRGIPVRVKYTMPIRFQIDESLQNSKTKSHIAVVDTVYQVVDEMPSFPGGDEKLRRFIAQHSTPEPITQGMGLPQRVILQFIVEKDGSLTHIEVVRSVDPYYDKEAVRIAKLMPKWIPGKHNGETVRVKYTQPVHFRLQ